MMRGPYAQTVAAAAVGLVMAGCGSPAEPDNTTTETTVKTPEVAPDAATAASPDLRSLIPVPANVRQSDGPDSIGQSGIHLHFDVSGSPSEVMDSYKAALAGHGWSITVEESGGGGGGGGATYTGTNGNAYGVFTGGGYGDTTDIDACAWPSKPAETSCGDDS